jgi:hypothetical protein
VNAAASVLSTLRDVRGVQGSFLVSPSGDTIARDMAAMFGDELLDDVGPRLVRLLDAFAAEGTEVLSCVVKYRDHVLLLRGARQGAVCVLCSPDVNMPALRMGVGLALRRLGPMLVAERAAPPVALARPRGSAALAPAGGRATPAMPSDVAVTPAPVPTPVPETGSQGIQYRGSILPKDRGGR